MASAVSKRLGQADELLQRRLSFADFLAKLPPKDRVNAERRVGVLEASAGPGLAELWRRLACALMTLSPHAAKLVGKQTVQFYIADGKYRMQVFALEDLQDGNITVYGPDVLGEAVEAGLLVRPPARADAHGAAAATGVYGIVGSGDALRIDALDRDSENLVAHFKDMVGWNRTAVRITLPPSASAAQVDAAERLCAIAALRFAPPPGAATGTTMSATGAGPRGTPGAKAVSDAPPPPPPGRRR
jgi:hypothetical protein